MKFTLTKIPVVEDILVESLRTYLREMRFGELFPHHKGLGVSNDHPFERLLSGEAEAPDIFPSVTIVSSSDGETPGMAKGWRSTELSAPDLTGFDPLEWYVSESAKADLDAVLAVKGAIYGLQHSTSWRDSVSIELWSENIQVKNDIYNLVLGFLSGPAVLELHNSHGLVIHSNSIQGQRSGYYNYDFGRTLYGGRVSLQVDYPIVQAVYDSEIPTITQIEHSYREVIHG